MMGMAAPLIPQEIYLLERYSSLDYFGRLRDAFAAYLGATDQALALYMRHLPPDYRSKPVHEQPDVVWGERVLPNLRWVMEGLKDGYIRMGQGDLSAMSQAGNVLTAFSSITRDYTPEWMPQPMQNDAYEHSGNASKLASNIQFTALAQWEVGTLTAGYSLRSRGSLDAPPSWPVYAMKYSARVRSGDTVTRSGIYLPDASGACAQLLIEGQEAWEASVQRLDTDPPYPKSIRMPTSWTLVERIAEVGGGDPGSTNSWAQGIRLRCEGGTPCPQDGWWFAPAGEGRRYIRRGEVMPTLGGDYGLTIWQMDIDQG
jgi:hypothetical protein